MSENVKEDLESLLARVTERRRELLTGVVNRRTRHFCMVLEDLFDPHNISAVIRTAEVFGLQDVHIIEEDNAYSVNKSILKGSYKWMSLYLYKKRMLCMEKLRAKGYRIAVASDLGSEFHGNHPDTLAHADYEFKLPQYGITESMNVSVAGGVLMTYLDVYMQKEGREKFLLPPAERDGAV